MKIVSTAWIPHTFSDFEMNACLRVHGQRNAATENHPYYIYILDGFENLDRRYIADLAERYVYLVDATEETSAIFERLRRDSNFYNPGQNFYYENLCFVRWLVLDRIMNDEPFIHIDTDLFFQDDNETISKLFTGRTGTFGSPCLTAVSDRMWLRSYSENLHLLFEDREAFQNSICYQGTGFRPNISSDQDLTVALEAAGRLPVHGMEELHERFQIFVNPLWPYAASPSQPMTYEDIEGRDYIGGKQVLFWHLQNNYANYLSRFATLKNYSQSWMSQYLPQKLCFPFIQMTPNAENFAFQALADLSYQVISEKNKCGLIDIAAYGPEAFFARTWISQWFVIQRQGRDLFTNDYWWENNIFS